MRCRYWICTMVVTGLLVAACEQQPSAVEKGGNTDSLAVQQATDVSAEAQVAETTLSYAARNGRGTYDKYCAVCHGAQGQGDGFNAYNLKPHPKDFTAPGYLAQVKDSWLLEVIAQGGRGAKRSVLMPAYENTLTRNEMQDVVAYLRHLSK